MLFAFAAPAASAGMPALDKALAAQVPELKDAASLPNYTLALDDLNQDTVPDAVVLLTGSDYCGSGGCTLLVLEGEADGFKLLSKTTLVREPLFVLPEHNHGWHTLSVFVAGGGAGSSQVLLRFDGKRYPSNPTLQERASAQQLTGAKQLTLE